ncbi:MAG: hypothetical protein P1P76_04220 [Anaerolineales bacterium]|nr:hypothetical protein [Anaerolineales bacterium]
MKRARLLRAGEEMNVILSTNLNGVNLEELDQEVGMVPRQAGLQFIVQGWRGKETQSTDREKTGYHRDKPKPGTC